MFLGKGEVVVLVDSLHVRIATESACWSGMAAMRRAMAMIVAAYMAALACAASPALDEFGQTAPP